MDNGIYLKLTRDQLQTVVGLLCDEAARATWLSHELQEANEYADRLVYERDEARENLDSALATIDKLRDGGADV